MSNNELKQIQAWAKQLPDPADEAIQGLYVHVPFCIRKCDYCDFYSEPGSPEAAHRLYVQALLSEAKLWREALPGELLNIQTVFFGGGTPTILAADLMHELISGLRQVLDLANLREWTIEANPATVNGSYLAMLRSHGVDRLSVGVQSFDDDDLRWLGRLHDGRSAEATLAAASAAGFSRLSADLIFGLPQQSIARWTGNLEKAWSLGLKHLSCYGLTYEEETPLGRRERVGEVRRADESTELELLRQTQRVLTRYGLDRYEISNYAVPGHECQHNLMYWSGGNYLGLGPAAASHLSGARWKNPPHLHRWERSIAAGSLLADDLELLTPRQRAGELVMLMLRTKKGVDCQTFEQRLRMKPMSLFERQVESFENGGLLERFAEGFRLSPRGFEVMDCIMEAFLL